MSFDDVLQHVSRDYEAGLAEGALQERERLKKCALNYLGLLDKNHQQKTVQVREVRLMERLFGKNWKQV